MKRLVLVILLGLLALPAWAIQDGRAFLETSLASWKEGTPMPGHLRPMMPVRKLTGYDVISVVSARLSEVDVTIANVFCTFEPMRGGEDPAALGAAKDVTARAVFRAWADGKAPGGFRVAVSWRDVVAAKDAPPPPPAGDATPLNEQQKTMASKLFLQIRGAKLDSGGHAQRVGDLALMGQGVIPLALKELRMGDMEVRRDLVSLIRRLGPPNTLQLLREELSNSVTSCARIVQRIQDDAAKAEDYRRRASKLKDTTGGLNMGGMSVPPEPTEKASFLRLAGEYDKKVAESRRDLDACAEVIETICSDLASAGGADDLAFLQSLVSDKGASTRPTAWGDAVVHDGEYVQAPPVGYSARRPVSVPAQEQDWLPWGPLWGTLRTLSTKCASREALQGLRDAMEKSFVPLEKKKTSTWEQTCLVTEFQHTEALVIARLSAADGPASAHAGVVEYAGDAKDRLLATLAGMPEKPGEDPVDKRRREGRLADLRRTVEDASYHVVMKCVPLNETFPNASAKPSKGPGDPVFTNGDYDVVKERLTVNAFLDCRDVAAGCKSRILLGTWDLPIKGVVVDEIVQGKRRARLELTGHVWAGRATPRTIGNLTDLVVPVVLERLALVDDKTGEVLSERRKGDAKDEPAKDAPKDKPATKDEVTTAGRDKIIEAK